MPVSDPEFFSGTPGKNKMNEFACSAYPGGIAENSHLWLDSQERYRSGRNGVDSKSICPVNSGARGFESHPLRQNLILTSL